MVKYAREHAQIKNGEKILDIIVSKIATKIIFNTKIEALMLSLATRLSNFFRIKYDSCEKLSVFSNLRED